ncbi:RsbR, positive regulator of sigma-B [Sandaracinus amylolyticus]|uniref:RsbR, positive regulator of sigma-B n=1 Tax=Sandaracinus amylolyticus TaxID=927083 RepID=A0A0F6YNK7_9BACT|nr:RsbR, positive regulator of sigma-B [Sandaracinus amylolyticus]
MVEVHADRIERIRDVLAMISLGEFDPAEHLIPSDYDDDFSSFEETINLFARQLHASVRESEAAMQKLEGARVELEAKLATIERQRVAIRELSTPVVELWEDIITLPVVGELDSQRAKEMTDRLLHRIAEGGARCAIVDVTGVAVVDTATAYHLLQMVAATRLLGTFCVLTGISPRVADTLSHAGVELRDVVTRGTLRDGLEECFDHLRAGKNGTAKKRATTQRTAKEHG